MAAGGLYRHQTASAAAVEAEGGTARRQMDVAEAEVGKRQQPAAAEARLWMVVVAAEVAARHCPRRTVSAAAVAAAARGAEA